MNKAEVLTAPASANSELTPRSLAATTGAAIGFLIGPSSIIAPPLGLFMLPVATEFGLGRAGFPLLMLMVSICAGVMSPLAGRAIDRYGVLKVIVPAVILSGLAHIGLASTSGSFPLYLCLMAMVGVLAGVQNPVAYTKVVAMWFRRHRGIMVSLAAAVGSGGGGILVPQLAEYFISMGGWQMGYAGLGGFILIGTPFLAWLLREPGVPAKRAHGAAPTPLQSMAVHGLSLREARATGTFWMILFALMAASASLVALTVHVPAWIADAGGSRQSAAAFLSLFALGGVVGQFGSGALLDRIAHARIGAPFFLVAASGVGLLQLVGATSPWVAAAGFMIGMALGTELGLASYFVSRYFGLRSYGQVYGCTYGAMVVASGAGPVVMGIGFEMSGSYLPAFMVAGVALLSSALLITILPAYRYPVAHLNNENED